MAAPDVLMAILTQMKEFHPGSSFISSLYQQYCNRGGLSKKQMEGLLDKVQRTPGIPAAKAATLQAIILKKPTRERGKPSITGIAAPKDETPGIMMQEILAKYPQHKRVLFLYSKYSKNEAMSQQETGEIKKFHQLLLKK